MPGHFVDRGKAYLKQTLPVDVHEITTDVHLHHIAGNGIVLAFFPNMLFKSSYAIMRAASLDAAVAVVDESAFIHLMRVVVIKVMHDAVAEVGGKHLTLFGVGDDKTGRGQRLISAVPQRITQRFKVFFQMRLKMKLIGLVALMAAGIIISLTQVGKKPFSRQAENGCFRQVLTRTHGSDRLSIVAVVVVHVVIVRIEVEFPRVVRVVRVERTRPVVAVRASVVELTVPTVARSGQEETPSKECVSGLFVFGAEGMPLCKPIASSVLSHA